MALAVRPPCDEALIRSTPLANPCARRAEPWVIAASVLGSSLAFIDGSAVNVALPVLQTDFGADVAGAQWVVEMYALFLAAFLLPGGALGDRFGRRRVFAAGIALFALASAWCGLASSIGQLVAARGLQGLGAAVLVPNSLALIGATIAPERKGRAVGTWSAFSALMMAAGPVLGGWLAQHASWRAVFYINVPLAAAVIAILYARVPESAGRRRGASIDALGTALIVLALGGIVFGLIESSNLGWAHPAVFGSLGAGVAALGAFLAVEARAAHPMLPLGLFRSRTFAGANLLTLFLYGALSGTLFFLPFNLLQVQGYSATAAGAAFLPFSALLFLLSRWSGGLADRIGIRPPLVAGPALAAAGMALFAFPGLGGPYWTTFFPAVAVLGLGMAVTVAPLTTSVLQAVDTENTGAASGVNNAVSRVAGLVVIALLGVLMVRIFTGSLDRRLADLPLPAGDGQEILAASTQLAALRMPSGMEPALEAAVRRAVAESFVDGYRAVMLICAALALAAAGSAWALVRRPAPSQEAAAAPLLPAPERARDPIAS